MFTFKKKKVVEEGLEKIPQHIGIIMDGNGRWAKKRLQPRVFGHKAGMDALQAVTIKAADLGVKVLTVYAFSTENWSRPEDEVKFIMNLPVEFFDRYVPELHKNGVRVEVIGETDRLPKETLAALNQARELTKDNQGLILNFALNYGGRRELTLAVQELAQQVADGKLTATQITEELIAEHLQTKHLPKAYQDPDLVIRTSGELRLSNFLPWQAAYSEFYFTEVLWPDFDDEQLLLALVDYNKRHRRFGGL
ncbi:isoprenyl transferase [Streptococcus sp. sy018]|uniref:isoprenyl transferase n=1 Tax=Streptococcus sp. sy018 TaxID=2600147 RepID=UPI0011B598FF|nr:isoprenyl transferase [Streptococcus sp. sy018]TWS94621.1 isoprenyl transferase [Streptococcus sp. sy018]